MPIHRDYIVWGYRLFLNREPESEQLVDEKARFLNSAAEVRKNFMNSTEFRQKVGAVAPAFAKNVVIKEIAPGLRLFIDLADEYIAVPIAGGIYEPVERAFIERALHLGDTAVDIGANVGYFAMLMAARVGKTGHVDAFEPLPRNASLLERSIIENGFSDRMSLHGAAIGARDGSLELISPKTTVNWGGAYLRTAAARVPADHEVIRVKVITIDGLVFPGQVKLIKLDAEGAEMLALQGARETLIRDQPPVLSELNPRQLRSVSDASATDVIRFMQQLRFTCRRVDSHDRIEAHDADEIINVVFEPDSPIYR